MLSKNFLPKNFLILFIFISVLVSTSSAIIEPLVPDWRGNDGTTFQEWSFWDNNPTPAPDNVDNPYEDGPLLQVDTDHLWQCTIDSADGVWPLSGEIDVVVPNAEPPNPYKEIWIKLVWMAEKDSGGDFQLNPFLPDEPLIAVTPFEYMDLTKECETVDLNGWYTSIYIATIWPNPPKEWISVKGNILVDYLSIETYCVPEPATIAILTAGCLWVLRSKRRKR